MQAAARDEQPRLLEALGQLGPDGQVRLTLGELLAFDLVGIQQEHVLGHHASFCWLCRYDAGRPRIWTYSRSVAIVVDAIYEERYWYPEDGGQVWLAGYQLVEPESGRYLARDAAKLGEPLDLRRDPGNEHDPNAIAVHAREGEQLGWVPREIAAELAPELDAGRPWSALVLREQRASPRDPRSGLTMLLAPDAELHLRAASP